MQNRKKASFYLARLKEYSGNPFYATLLEYLNEKANELKDELVEEMDRDLLNVLRGKVLFIKDFIKDLTSMEFEAKQTLYFD